MPNLKALGCGAANGPLGVDALLRGGQQLDTPAARRARRKPRTRALVSDLPLRLAVPLLAGVLLCLAACTASGGTPAGSDPTGPTRSTSGGGPSSTSPSGSETPSPSPATTRPSASGTPGPTSPAPLPSTDCTALVAELSLAQRVGQLLMVSVSSAGLTSSRAAVIRRTHAGSVLLLGNSKAGSAAIGRLVVDVRHAADRPRGVKVLLAADQEGGLVQRLAGRGFTDIPSAVRQAQLSDAELTAQATTWGKELGRAGIDVNLAPVADVVPRDLVTVNQPVAQLRRGYGASPALVARKVAAFTRGMDQAGIATSVKHFPGLGQVRGNTDTEPRVVDSVTNRTSTSLRGFAAAVDAGVDMVMASSATYTRIDPDQQAAFSPTVVDGMIRGDLGFDGVVISDDLAARGVSNVPGAQRAVRFVQAGGDLVIVADPALAAEMAKELVARAKSDPDFAARIDQSAARVLTLKDRRGLVGC